VVIVDAVDTIIVSVTVSVVVTVVVIVDGDSMSGALAYIKT